MFWFVLAVLGAGVLVASGLLVLARAVVRLCVAVRANTEVTLAVAQNLGQTDVGRAVRAVVERREKTTFQGVV